MPIKQCKDKRTEMALGKVLGVLDELVMGMALGTESYTWCLEPCSGLSVALPWNCPRTGLQSLKDVEYRDRGDCCQNFPGNTSDYSEGLLGGWKLAMNNFVQNEFGIDRLSTKQIANMYGYCNQHYQHNVVKVSNISKYVDPSKKYEFSIWQSACQK